MSAKLRNIVEGNIPQLILSSTEVSWTIKMSILILSMLQQAKELDKTFWPSTVLGHLGAAYTQIKREKHRSPTQPFFTSSRNAPLQRERGMKVSLGGSVDE